MNTLKILRVAGWSLVAILLLLPAVAMYAGVDGVLWTASDFVVAAILLGGTGLLIEITVRISKNWAFRGGMAMGILTSLLLVWMNLAVGLIGNEENVANLMYLVVLALGPVGGLFARFDARRMSQLMIAAALCQVAIGIVALALNFTDHVPSALFLNGAFAVLWLIAAGLFHNATAAHNSQADA